MTKTTHIVQFVLWARQAIETCRIKYGDIDGLFECYHMKTPCARSYIHNVGGEDNARALAKKFCWVPENVLFYEFTK